MHCKLIQSCGNLVAHMEAGIRNRPNRNQALLRIQAALLICLLAISAPAGAAELKQEAAQGFDRYARLTERRMQSELAPGGAFLWVDGLPEARRSEAHARLQRGDVVSARLQAADSSGRPVTPGALIHHWVGIVFIPGASLQQVLTRLQDYDHHSEYYKPEVVKSKTLEHAGNDFRVYLRLMRKKVVTVVLDTEYDVHYQQLDAAHELSDSRSTRIAEVAHAGEPSEHELPPGNDGGFLWRLNSYWRFAEEDHGVYVQCEAISLTRDIPVGLNWLIDPFIETIPKESLEFTLQSTRSAVLRAGVQASR